MVVTMGSPVAALNVGTRAALLGRTAVDARVVAGTSARPTVTKETVAKVARDVDRRIYREAAGREASFGGPRVGQSPPAAAPSQVQPYEPAVVEGSNGAAAGYYDPVTGAAVDVAYDGSGSPVEYYEEPVFAPSYALDAAASSGGGGGAAPLKPSLTKGAPSVTASTVTASVDAPAWMWIGGAAVVVGGAAAAVFFLTRKKKK